jgi:hypothetical protein
MPSLVYTATNGRIYRNEGATICTSVEYSMSGWVYLPSALTDVGSTLLEITNNSAQARRLLINASNTMQILSGSYTFNSLSTTPSFAQWVYVAMCGNGVNTLGYWWTDSAGVPALGGSITTSLPGSVNLTICGWGCDPRNSGSVVDVKVAYGKLWTSALSQSDFETEMYSPDVETNSGSFFAGFVSADQLYMSPGDSKTITVTGATGDSDTPPVVAGLAPIVLTWTM